MSGTKTALPKQVRVVKYFETRNKDDEKVIYSPSEKAIQIADKELLKEALEAGLVVEHQEEELDVDPEE